MEVQSSKPAVRAVYTTQRKYVNAYRESCTRYLKGGLEVQVEAERVWKLLQELSPYAAKRQQPRVDVRTATRVYVMTHADGTNSVTGAVSRGARGRAYLTQGFVRLYDRTDWHTLAHELVHMALPWNVGHSQPFYVLLRQVIEARWNITLSTYGAPARYGYAWDAFYRSQYLHLTNVEGGIPSVDMSAKPARKVAAERKSSGKPRVTAQQVEQWLLAHPGELVKIADVMQGTGAAVNTVRKHVGTLLTPYEYKAGMYRIAGVRS